MPQLAFFLGALCLFAQVSHARPAPAGPASAVARIGYVDLARALNEVEEGKTAKSKLKSDFDQKQQKLDKMQNEFKAKKDEFDKRSPMMKADARQAKQEELQREISELQKNFMQMQQELVDSQSLITDEIGKKLKAIIEKIGDRDGFQLVMNIGGDAVLYHKRHLDITDDVIGAYNKQFGKK